MATPVHVPTRARAPRRHHLSRLQYGSGYCPSLPFFVPTYSSIAVIINDIPEPPREVFDEPLLIPQEIPLEDQPIIIEAPAPEPQTVEPLAVPQPYTIQAVQPTSVQCHVVEPLRFADFPYQDGLPGFMANGLNKEWSGSALFEYGSDFDRLDRRGFGFLVEHELRFGIDFKWDSYVEDYGDGWTDELHLTDINLMYRIAQSEQYAIRAGLGMNILGDAYDTDAGFNITTKADFFPCRRLVLSGEMDLGTIGDAEMFHLAGKAGLMFDRFEVFAGYDYRTIGSVPLEGTMFGLQVWF